MAHAALVSLIQTVKQTPHPHRILDLPNCRIESTLILERATSLLAFLEDSRWKFDKILEGRMRDAAYQAEDIVESHISSLIHFQFESQHGVFWKYVFRLLNLIPYLSDQIKMKTSSKNVIEQFDSILVKVSNVEEEEDIGIDVIDLRPENSVSTDSSSRFAARNKITEVEFENELQQIKHQLTGSPSKLSIIPIVGMGGMGKTTIAKYIYSDQLIKEHFDIRACTAVSPEYSKKNVIINLLDSISHVAMSTVEVGGEMNIDRLEEMMHKIFKGRRYLIAVDDLWDIDDWYYVKRVLPDDNNGSRIILTSQLSNFAVYADSLSHIHQMRFFSLDGGWNLFLEKVFGGGICPPELELDGKKIVSNCQGLPLAIDVIGGLLSNVEKTPEFWQCIADNTGGTSDHIPMTLTSSYDHLPQHLKACFLYMGAVFPKGQEILVSRLIKLWVAEGFLKPTGDKSLEQVAKDNLKDLTDRSLILVGRYSSDGKNIKTYKIHDILIDLCIKKASEENFLKAIRDDSGLHPEGGERRLSIHFTSMDEYPKLVIYTPIWNPNVRSFLHSDKSHLPSDVISLAMTFRRLRVFDVISEFLKEFPAEIVELVNLRYLAFKCHMINFSPSISNLRNLQTIILYGGPDKFIYLPSEIWKMQQLRHIMVDRCILMYPSNDAEIDDTNFVPLENLQTLANVSNFKFTERVLRAMPNLKKLVISYVYDSLTSWSPDYFSHFIHLHHLETLRCYFTFKSLYAPKNSLNFVFPVNLKKLTLSGCTLPWERLTVVGSLPYLEVLKLKDDAFVGPVWRTNEEEFPELKYFLIASGSLEKWITEENHFPNLRQLSLKSCSKLEEIPSEIGEITTLQKIELLECSASVEDSARQIKNKQEEDLGYSDLHVLCM